MKFLLIALFVAVASAADSHTTLNDFFDYKAVVANPPEMKRHIKCFISEGPCDELLESFKQNMPAAVEETCARCTVPQMVMFGTFMNGLKTMPKYYKKYSQKYDPEGKLMPLLEAKLAPHAQ